MRKLLFLLLFLPQLLLGAKLPEITNKDVANILADIMRAHVSHKEITTTLIARALENYLNELDPMKCYFLKEEVAEWIEPSQELLDKVKEEVESHNFSAFFAIHEQMVNAIGRREKLDKKVERINLDKKVSIKELKDLDWATTEESLIQRLVTVKELQNSAVQKLDAPLQKKATLRLKKRRKTEEEEIVSPSCQERMHLVLSNVLKAFAAAFDSHTAYFTPAEASQFMIQVQQRLFGIGVQLRDDINGFTVVKVIEGGPASKQEGLKDNDLIIAINGEPVVGLEITDVVELIRGQENTSVLLTVLRMQGEQENKVDVEITRGEVVIQEARLETHTIPFGNGVIAHVALHAFYQDPLHSSAGDIADELIKIQNEHNLKGVILDLRMNSGGVLPQAVAVTGLFINKGIVASIKDNNGKIEHLRTIDSKINYSGPLVVVVNKASASASEIVAQTLQDYGRAIIVGDEHTFGKGSFQTFTYDALSSGTINPKGEFKVTRGRYYTVSGKSPQLVGVFPDIIVPGSCCEMEIGEKHTKYPLESDAISAHFDDDLSDIEPRQRAKIDWLYRLNLQTKISTYTNHLKTLKANSEMRLANHRFYKKMLAELKKQEDCDMDFVQAAHEADPQLQESIHILQDLIVLLN